MTATAQPKGRSGMVVLLGRSNVGKSTLINSLIGTKVAITTPKPQTTRDTIQGVLNDPRGQAVFIDTPGIFTQVPDNLTEKLNEKARESLAGIDVIVYVVDPTRHVGDEEEIVHRMILTAKVPKILVLNKSDKNGRYKEEYLAWRHEFDTVIEISALSGGNMKALVDAVFTHLPEGEQLYPPEILSDRDAKFRMQELIREKVFLRMDEEVPYSTAVEVLEMAERENGTLYVRADVLTSDNRYKRMLIGAGGQRIKRIGQSVRKELELVMRRKVFVDLDVVVEPHWKERFE